MYRWTWTLGFAGLFVVNTALVRHGLPDRIPLAPVSDHLDPAIQPGPATREVRRASWTRNSRDTAWS
jgi:hypothetical protein